MTTYIIIRVMLVILFGLIIGRLFNSVYHSIKLIQEIKQPQPFGDFGWVFFKHKKSDMCYAYNAVTLSLELVQVIKSYPTIRMSLQGENVNRNLDLQTYLYDKAKKGSSFSFTEITREEFLIVYNTK